MPESFGTWRIAGEDPYARIREAIDRASAGIGDRDQIDVPTDAQVAMVLRALGSDRPALMQAIDYRRRGDFPDSTSLAHWLSDLSERFRLASETEDD